MNSSLRLAERDKFGPQRAKLAFSLSGPSAVTYKLALKLRVTSGLQRPQLSRVEAN